MASNVKIIIETLYKGQGVKDATKDLKELGRGGGALDTIKANWGSITAGIGLATGAIVAFGVAAKKAVDIGAEGAGVKRLEASFKSLTATAEVSGDKLFRALDNAARGTISNTDLILSTNRAMMLGLGADAEQLGQLMEVAAFRGRAMGLTTTQAFNDIVTGVGRGSAMILDNLGIVLDAEKTYEDYATAIGKTKDELTKQEKTQALLTRVIEEGNKQMEAAGGLTDDTAAAYEKLDAQARNLTDTWKKQAAEGLEPIVKWLGDALERSDDYEQAVQKTGLSYEEFTRRAREAGMSVNDFTQFILDGGNAFGEFTTAQSRAISNAESFDRALMNQNRSLEDTTPAIEDNTDALKEQSKAYQTLLSNMFKIQDLNESFIEDEEERAKQQKELEDEKVRLAIETTKKKEDLLRDLAELDRDVAKQQRDAAYSLSQVNKEAENAAERRAHIEDSASERQHDLMVRRQEILERIQELQDDAVVKQVELDEKLNELAEEGTKAIEDQEKARKELVYSMLEQKAAQDDIISTEELRFLQDTAVQMGLVDRASADMAIAAAEAADLMWEQFQKPGEAVGDIQAALNRVVQGSPYRAQIVIEQVGGIPSIGTGAANAFAGRRHEQTLFNSPLGGGFAEGGSFVVPGSGTGDRPYMLGLTPGEHVQVTPKGESPNKSVNVYIDKITDRAHIRWLAQEISAELG